MDKEKEEFFRELFSLRVEPDDEYTNDEDELRDIMRKSRRSKPPSSVSSSFPSFLPSSARQSPETRRHQSQARTKTPAILRTTSAPVSSFDFIKETPLIQRKPSLLRYDISSPSVTPKPSIADASVIEETPPAVEEPRPVRSISTPVIGSVFMKNSSGIASMLNKRPALTKKRKRKSREIKLVPEGKRIFAGQTFFYVPNDDVAQLRRARIEKAIEHGAIWTTEWTMDITHVFVEKRFDYSEVMTYLAPLIKANTLPSSIILVNDDYPLHCIQFSSLLDPKQERYTVTQAEAEASSVSLELDQNLNKTLQLKSGKLHKGRNSPDEWTPPRNRPLTQVAGIDLEGNSKTEAEVPGTISDERQVEIPTYARRGDALDEIIEAALKAMHLPLDDDEDSERPSSSEGQEEVGSSDEESAIRAKKVKPKFAKRGGFDQESFSCMKGGTGITLDSNPNKHTISILEEMAGYYSRIRDEWRTRAYRQAVGTLKRQTEKISTYEEALALPMIGSRLATKIEEIAHTNRLRRLDNTKLDASDQALQIFTKIYNVGFAVASRWVQAGYKTLDDLKAHATLTPKQLIGIEHYDDFNTRIPRDEVFALGEIVKIAAASIDPEVTAMIMGSYRRGAPSSGDIDILLTRAGSTSSQDLLPFLHTLVDQLFKQGFLVTALAEPRDDGGSKWHGACILSQDKPIWRRIDFLLVPETQMGAALIYFTGDDIFNRSIRLLSSRQGLRLNQEGLFKDVMRGASRAKLNEGTMVEGADEMKIFEILGVPWRPPEHRILH